MNRIHVAAAIVVALSLAYFSTAHAIDQFAESAGGVEAPLAERSGFSLANLAERVIASNVTEATAEVTQISLPEPQAREVRQLATLALQREPLNADALKSLALVAHSSGQAERAHALFRHAHELTRRDLVTNIWLATYYGRAGGDESLLAMLDEALRSSQAGRAALFPMLTQALADDRLVEPLERLLNESPIWEQDFWSQATSQPAALVNVARLRARRAAKGYEGVPIHDRALANRLVEERHFAEAEVLFAALEKPAPSGNSLVYNGDFSQSPEFRDLDWRLYFSGSVLAEILPAEGLLKVDTYEGGGGPVARQLVALEGNSFRLEMRAAEWEDRDQDVLYARVICAEGGFSQDRAVRIDFGAPQVRQAFVKPHPTCTYHWLEIRAHPQPDRQANSVYLSAVAIQPESRH